MMLLEHAALGVVAAYGGIVTAVGSEVRNKTIEAIGNGALAVALVVYGLIATTNGGGIEVAPPAIMVGGYAAAYLGMRGIWRIGNKLRNPGGNRL